MKIKIIISVIFLLFFSSCGEEQIGTTATQTGSIVKKTQADTVQSLKGVNAAEFEKALNTSQEYHVLDLRTTGELKASGIIGQKVTQIDMYEDANYLEKIKQLDTKVKYAIYCRSGGRSGTMLTIMKRMGFTHVIDLKGGINSWSRSGNPLVSYDASKIISK